MSTVGDAGGGNGGGVLGGGGGACGISAGAAGGRCGDGDASGDGGGSGASVDGGGGEGDGCRGLGGGRGGLGLGGGGDGDGGGGLGLGGGVLWTKTKNIGNHCGGMALRSDWHCGLAVLMPPLLPTRMPPCAESAHTAARLMKARVRKLMAPCPAWWIMFGCGIQGVP